MPDNALPSPASLPPAATGEVSLWRRFTATLGRWMAGGFVPFPVHRWEWVLMRIAFAALVMHTFMDWHPFKYASQPAPVGIATLVDLSFLHRPGMFEFFRGLGAVGLTVYILGFGLRFVLPVLALASTMIYTYSNSQGFTHHGVQLVTLVLIGQSLVAWWWWWKQRQGARDIASALPLPLQSYMVYYSTGIIAFSYVISAVTKITNSKGMWVLNAKYLCIEIVKSQRLNYYGDLDPAQKMDPPVAVWLLQHPLAATVLFGSGFFLECFAFVALRDRIWAFIIGVSLIAMHESISWIMELDFHNHEALVLIFLINLPFWFARLAFPRALR
ncbi:hypothetical protein [Verrucomicrobium sp. BvORR106]|uniref:hypothetical protein n=1 Tax=Verrucomicrobium sp. BvORR106 TaxID=1403819 RepID=UPI000571A808|nr:hypothetical protein [Verrucomicrobium sp. BvORR106]